MYVDASETVAEPYSRGNELVFERNARQQCVAMSLCYWIYNNKQGVSFANDLSQIMNIGNPDVFKFVSISQTVLFNADRFTYNVKCA